MRKKRPRDIPDFSRQSVPRRGTPAPVPPAPQASRVSRAARAPAPQAKVKPQATSAKSGRRGQ